jgi:beta-lactam-binding protein with PASTA domain
VGRYIDCTLTLADARLVIAADDLVVGNVFAGSTGDVSEDWLVAQQFPEPGAQVPPGSTVDLLVKSPTDPCP